jgi:hypothetical protein
MSDLEKYLPKNRSFAKIGDTYRNKQQLTRLVKSGLPKARKTKQKSSEEYYQKCVSDLLDLYKLCCEQYDELPQKIQIKTCELNLSMKNYKNV